MMYPVKYFDYFLHLKQVKEAVDRIENLQVINEVMFVLITNSPLLEELHGWEKVNAQEILEVYKDSVDFVTSSIKELKVKELIEETHLLTLDSNAFTTHVENERYEGHFGDVVGDLITHCSQKLRGTKYEQEIEGGFKRYTRSDGMMILFLDQDGTMLTDRDIDLLDRLMDDIDNILDEEEVDTGAMH